MAKKLRITYENINADTLVGLCPHVSQIECLTLGRIYGVDFDEPRLFSTFPTFARSFSKLKRLRITCVLRGQSANVLLSHFAPHFPHLERFKFRNLYETWTSPPPGNNTQPTLINLLPTLTQLTHLHFQSEVMVPRVCDEVLVEVATHCPRMTNLRLHHFLLLHLPADISIIALAHRCRQLSTLHIDDWLGALSGSFLDALLTHCTSLVHLRLPQPSRSIAAVNATLAKHAHVTQITTTNHTAPDAVYASPHIRTLKLKTGSGVATSTLSTYLLRNPALTDVTVHTTRSLSRIWTQYDNYDASEYADIKRRFPNLKRLVWKRFWKSAKTEARYEGGPIDPRVHRVFF